MTTRVVRTCDKCKAGIDGRYGSFEGQITVEPAGVLSYITHWPWKTLRADLCADCARVVQTVIWGEK